MPNLISFNGRGIRWTFLKVIGLLRWVAVDLIWNAILDLTTRPVKRFLEKHRIWVLLGCGVFALSFLSPTHQVAVMQSGVVQIPVMIAALYVGIRFLTGKPLKFFGGKKK